MATPAQHKWSFGRISQCWSQYRELDYRNEPFNDSESLQFWSQLGFANQKFTGDLYDMRNTPPEWMERVLEHYSAWQNVGWSLYRMGPGTCLPLHSDTYARYKQIHHLSKSDTVVRSIVFLEDWQSGHYFEIDKTPIVNWTAGDTVTWENDTPHVAANFGFTDRYTLQITGTPR